ncbi:MAG: hypothetical protein HYY06_03070 [Deltaproteobacteria bacterium]|nr:hypothetical protein [Deltaproteobacteria bacterium]
MTTRFAGCDLGKTSLHWAIARAAEDGSFVLEATGVEAHGGEPLAAFARWYRAREIDGSSALGATGLYAGDLRQPAVLLPEDACQEAALDFARELPPSLNLISVGGRGYSVLTRRPGGGQRWDVRYLENEKCSSGTGENMVKIAARFGLTLAEADAMALTATEATPITARCSVFTKSEMTHYANEGRPHGALFRGYFESVARNAFGLLARARVPGPVYLIGGCAQLEALRRALAELAGEEVHRPEHFHRFEAIGAALLAAQARAHAPLPRDPAALVRKRDRIFAALPPAAASRDRVTMLPPEATGEDWRRVPTVLGLDLGSTGAKAALASVATGALLIDVYDTTRGNPVEAAQRLVRAILAGGAPDVRAIGVTGSGRQAVATVLRAAFPGDAARVVVQNEIVAHATAAIRCDPDSGADLSIIEIGGQDAKYIRVSGGRIIESDMNKACSAGTGSFLAEQAALYEVHDQGELTRLASEARRPPDLGQMCTVYVAESAARAREQGFDLGDLFAGFQYSVVHNYLHRVMGQRTLARRVFFQGKPAQNPSLGWTLAAVAERDITVPPNPGAMGAWGIGLAAAAQIGPGVLAAAPPFDPAGFLDARIAERSQVVCRDDDCRTLCAIDRTVVRLGERHETTFTGGACPKFELSTRDQPKLAKDAPDPFEERDGLLAAFERRGTNGHDVAIPVVGAVAGHVPWLATLAAELGYGVRLLRPDARSLAIGEQLANSFDSCGPTKVSHAVCDADVPLLLFPRIVDVHALDGPGGDTCVTAQALPEMAEQALRGRGRKTKVVHPTLGFRDGTGRAAVAIAAELGADPARAAAAAAAADRAQAEYERSLRARGEAALAWARANGVPAVLVCGSLHVLHDRSLNAGIPGLLRRNGALPIPVDCFPIDPATPPMAKVYWGDANRYLRAAASARASGDVFPLLLASFGCGPASFMEQVFQALLEGYPHTILENDGHGGTAGFVTRIQAFLQSVRQFVAEGEGARAVAPSKAYAVVEPMPRRGPYLDRGVRYVFMSGTDYLGAVFAAVYRAAGYDAVAAPPLSEQSAACGRRDCSGKECLSYQLIWGAFRHWLEENPTDKEVRLVQISGRMCRAGSFPLKDRITLERMGWDDHVGVTALRVAGGPAMTLRVWIGLVAVDLLRQLYLYHLAVEGAPGEAEARYREHAEAVLAILGEPDREGLAGATHLAAQWRRLCARIDAAAADFAAIERRRPVDGGERLPVVFLSGDLMTKGNDFASGGLCKELAQRGVRIVFEPTCDFLEFLAEVHPALLFGQGATARSHLPYRVSMVAVRDTLYARVKEMHPWLPLPEIERALARCDELLDRTTNGGATLTVGSTLHHWRTGAYDGVVLASCWGCDNGKVAESLLRHQRDLPALYYYDDGTPLDERRLDRFVFQLRRGTKAPVNGTTAGLRSRTGRRLRRLTHVLGATRGASS